jgi:hypothetical protein
MEVTIKFSPAKPLPTPFKVQKRIQGLRGYLDPNNPICCVSVATRTLDNQIEQTKRGRGCALREAGQTSEKRFDGYGDLQTRKLVSKFWSQCLISAEAFILLGSTVRTRHMKSERLRRCENLLDVVRQQQDSFNKVGLRRYQIAYHCSSELHSGRSLPIIKGQRWAIASAFLGPILARPRRARGQVNIYSASGDARQIAGDVLTTFTGPIDKVEVLREAEKEFGDSRKLTRHRQSQGRSRCH